MFTILAFGFPGLPEMMIVGLVVLLLFGSRLPSVMRSLGVGITEFQKGIKGEIDAEGQPVSGGATLEEQSKSDSEDSQSSSHSPSSTSV